MEVMVILYELEYVVKVIIYLNYSSSNNIYRMIQYVLFVIVNSIH